MTSGTLARQSPTDLYASCSVSLLQAEPCFLFAAHLQFAPGCIRVDGDVHRIVSRRSAQPPDLARVGAVENLESVSHDRRFFRPIACPRRSSRGRPSAPGPLVPSSDAAAAPQPCARRGPPRATPAPPGRARPETPRGGHGFQLRPPSTPAASTIHRMPLVGTDSSRCDRTRAEKTFTPASCPRRRAPRRARQTRRPTRTSGASRPLPPTPPRGRARDSR
jgi:hypothetical protein